jgi:chromosomal replication initiation ATPase DnaA
MRSMIQNSLKEMRELGGRLIEIERIRYRLRRENAPRETFQDLDKRHQNEPGLLSIQREAESLFGKRAEDSRRVALYLSHRLSGQTLGEIGNHFGGISPSAVSQNTRRVEERLRGEAGLSEKVSQLKRILSE